MRTRRSSRNQERLWRELGGVQEPPKRKSTRLLSRAEARARLFPTERKKGMTVGELIQAFIPFGDQAEVVIFVPKARLRWGTYQIASITPYSESGKRVVINLQVEDK